LNTDVDARSHKGLGKRLRRRRKRNGETITPAVMPQEIVERIERVREYHESTKHSYESVRLNPNKLDAANQPSAFRLFTDHPKVDLPTDLIEKDAPALALLSEGLSGLPEDAAHLPQDLNTLASWLRLANGITEERRVSRNNKVQLRSCPSSSAVFPFEIYVAAFGVQGLEPGLYHYSCKEFALRKLRDGDATLARIKKGRPDLDFLKTVPAALLVSTIFCRSTWRYRQRGYRYALLDAGHLVQNLVTAANGLGIQTTTRLSMNDRNTRELIGVPADAPFGEAEAVQAMVVWGENAAEPLAKANGTPQSADALPPIPREPLAQEVTAYEQILMVHEDCVAPGVAVRELRPPLTELSPRRKGRPPAELDAPVPASGGPSLRQVMTKRRSAADFRRAPIPLDKLWTICRLAFRGGSYFPLFPSGPHVGLIRPMWIISDVDRLDTGVWNYDPVDDHWTQHKAGIERFEQQYLCLEQPICGNASAVCFMLADLKPLMDRGGPDTYRLAHLEAGIVGQRMFLAAHALGVGCTGIGPVYDAETLAFLDPDPSGWEVIYSAVLGEAKTEKPAAG
jgi:SagB-type dehydrogenase family enzyme